MVSNKIQISGEGLLKCWNQDGSLAWTRHFRNAPTNQGLDHLGAVEFAAGAQSTIWYAGLIDLVGFTTLAATDTMVSHGWSENTSYSGNRPTWVNQQGGQQVASNGPFSFNVTANGIIHGLFIANSATRGGTTGTLWATALLSSDAVITVGQTLTGTYSVKFAGA